MEIRIERLRHASGPVVEMLNHLLRQLSEHPDELTEDVLESILASDTSVFVAVDEGRIVGTASLIPVHQLMGTKCWIEDVVVDDDYRGRGLGRKLMEYALMFAPVGTTSINLTSSRTRETARHLYHSLGFEEREGSDLFRLRL